MRYLSTLTEYQHEFGSIEPERAVLTMADAAYAIRNAFLYKRMQKRGLAMRYPLARDLECRRFVETKVNNRFPYRILITYTDYQYHSHLCDRLEAAAYLFTECLTRANTEVNHSLSSLILCLSDIN